MQKLPDYLRKDQIHHRILFVSGFVVLLITMLMSLKLGSVNMSWSEFGSNLLSKSEESSLSLIIWQYRIPKLMTALLAGAGLSVAGVLMQSFFSNPLAGPFVMGISSGASLGAALILMGMSWFPLAIQVQLQILGPWAQLMGSIMGSVLMLILILLLSFRIKDITTLLIVGLMSGMAVSALVSILTYFADSESMKSFALWSMGNVNHLTPDQILVLFIAVVSGVVFAWLLAKPLNIWLLGESYAVSLGMSKFRSRFFIIFITGLLAGSVSAFCGPIGFIGVVVPHLSRWILKNSRHEVLIPFSALLGGIILIWCDIIAQLPGNDLTLPLNSVTSLAGAPIIVLFMIYSLKRRGGVA